MPKALTQEEFIERSTKIHGNTYNYHKVNYTNNTVKVIIVCKIHGEYLQSPKTHMKGHGCHQCKKDNQCLSREEFILNSLKIHNNKYMYNLVQFRSTKEKVTIICPVHGIFKQSAAGHLAGRGCSQCWNLRSGEKYSNKITILYYIKIFAVTGPLYKIGITTRSIAERYAKEAVSYEVLQTTTYANGFEAFTAEQQIITKNVSNRFTGITPFLWTGTSELFTTDILNKDINE